MLYISIIELEQCSNINLILKSDIVAFTAINAKVIKNYTVNFGVLTNEKQNTDIACKKMTIMFLMNDIIPL